MKPTQDPSRPLADRRYERAAAYISEVPNVTVRALAEHSGVTTKTAQKYQTNPVILERALFLQRFRARGLIPKALRVLDKLLDSEDEKVALMAAREVLDRTAFNVTAPQEEKQAFSVVLNLAPLKTPTSQGPPPPSEEFSPSGNLLEGRLADLDVEAQGEANGD